MSLKSYFDLFRKPIATARMDGDQPPNHPNPLPQWIALFLGVLIQPFFSYFKKYGGNNIQWGEIYQDYYILFGIIVAVIVFPSVYRVAFDTNRPKFLQIIPIFTTGLGWQTMVDSLFNPDASEESSTASFLFHLISEHSFLFV